MSKKNVMPKGIQRDSDSFMQCFTEMEINMDDVKTPREINKITGKDIGERAVESDSNTVNANNNIKENNNGDIMGIKNKPVFTNEDRQYANLILTTLPKMSKGALDYICLAIETYKKELEKLK